MFYELLQCSRSMISSNDYFAIEIACGDFLKTLLIYFANFTGSYAVSILKILQNLEVSCLKLSSHTQQFDLTDLRKTSHISDNHTEGM